MQSRLTFENGHLKLREPSQDELLASSQESTEAPEPSPDPALTTQSENTARKILLQKCKPVPRSKVPPVPWQPPGDLKCYLLSIPPEIRLSIYRHLLISHQRDPCVFYKHGEEFCLVGKNPWDCPLEIHPQILKTCKTINKEGTRILYGQNLLRRGYCWPLVYTNGGARTPLPLSKTSLISQANLAYISRIMLFRDYHRWFRDEKLKVLDEFPSLKELQVHIDMNDICEIVDSTFEALVKDTIRTIHRDRPDIPFFEMEIRLSFHGRDYDDWEDEYTRGKESFSYHLIKKTELEAWMQQEGLFCNRPLSWSFKTLRSQYCGPSCYITFSSGAERGKAKYIKCEMHDDDTEAYGVLKVNSKEKEISVDVAL